MSRLRTPTVIQMETVECGAASLAIMLEHFGKWVPLDELRAVCNVSRDGCNAADILRAARSYGLEAKGYSYGLEKVSQLRAPFIVFWEFRHFLVVEGFGKGSVHLNDPECGPRTVPLEDFSRSYTGLALTFKPTASFEPSGRRPGVTRDLLSRLRQARSGLVMLILVSLLLIIPGLAIPTFSKVFIDFVLIQGMDQMLRPLLLAMLIVVIAYAATNWLQEWCLMRIESKIALTGSADFIIHMLKLPIRFFTQRNPGDLVARLLANDAIAQSIGDQVGRNVANFMSVAFFAVVMLAYDVLLAAICIGINVIAAIGSVQARRILRNTSLKLETEHGMLLGLGVLGIRSIDSIKASASEDQAFSRWAASHVKTVNTEQELGRITNLISVLPNMALTLTTAIALGVGSFRIVEGPLTIGGLVAFLALIAAFSRPFEGLVQFISELQRVSASLARANDILEHPVAGQFDRQPSNLATNTGRLSGRVELKNVTFGYSESGPPLIENLNMTIEPGARVALVGASGSGKSTVGQLVAGLYQPLSGEILYDGVPIQKIRPSLLESSVGWVSQDIFLFEGSVYDNLTLWDSTISLETVIKAAKDAEIHDVVSRRPGGYEGHLLEGAPNLSGGEAQRLEIARTLALEPSLLILDEATSSLDALVEQRIDRNIQRRGCSCLIIAHRLSTIRDAEEILVLDKGHVVERGTHHSLMNAGGRYRDLVEY